MGVRNKRIYILKNRNKISIRQYNRITIVVIHIRRTLGDYTFQ